MYSCFIGCLFVVIAQAQAWQPCNIGVNGNNTWGTAVCVHNNKVFACNNTVGLQVSTDNGATWSVVNSSIIGSLTSVDMYSTGNRLYIQQTNTGCMELQYSDNDGVTFQLDTLALPKCYAGSTQLPSSATYGATMTWNNHVIMSLAGPDWEWSRNTADAGWVDASYFDANDCSEFYIKNDTCWAATNGATSNGVAWSVDGLNWTSPSTVGLPPYYVPTSIAWNGNRLFMMGGDVGAANAGADTILKYSDDYGITFQEVNIKQYLDPSAFFSASGKQPTLDMFTAYGKLYLILGQDVLETAPELIVSNDNGMTFEKDTVGFPTAVLGSLFTIKDMEFHDGWVFAQLNSGDLFRKQVGPSGVQEVALSEGDIVLYPNPASQEVSVSSKNKIRGMQLMDMTGTLLSKSQNEKMDVSHLSAGIYFVVVELENNLQVIRKLTISK